MDELDLIQEAVSNWESLYEIEVIDTFALPSDDTEARSFLSRIQLKDREKPICIEIRVLNESENKLRELFDNGKPVAWSRPGYSLN